MAPISRRSPPILMLVLGVAAAGCGGEDSKSSRDHASLPPGAAAMVDDVVITEAAVRTRLDADLERAHITLKEFSPPDYPICVKIRRLQSKHASQQKLLEQCRVQLMQSRAQTVDLLVRAQLLPREVERHGITAVVNRKARKAFDTVVSIGDPATAVVDRKWQAVQTTMVAQAEGLIALMSVSKRETAAYRKAHPDVPRDAQLGYTIRAEKLEKTLHAHYASETTCAKRYRVEAAPLCL